jgi:hypothetical protein
VYQLIYASRATAHVDHTELVAITAQSAADNTRRGVTGALLFCGGYFLQMLEGDESTVRKLYARIAGDPRHADVQLLAAHEVAARAFPNWGMCGWHEQQLASELDPARVASLIDAVRAGVKGRQLTADAVDLLNDLRAALTRSADAA